MEEDGKCDACGALAVVIDDQTGEAGCQECGKAADGMNLRHQTGGFQNGEWSEFGQVVSDHRAGAEVSKGMKSEKSHQQLFDDFRGFASVLSLTPKIVNEGESLLNETKHYYSTGAVERNLYLGAVIYVSVRRCAVPITMYEVASCVGRSHQDLTRKYRRFVKACSLRVPAHNICVFLDRFADDLIEFLESKQLLKCNKEKGEKDGGNVIPTRSRARESSGKRQAPINDPPKQKLLELVHDLKEFLLHRPTIREPKPIVFAGVVLHLSVESLYSRLKVDFISANFFQNCGFLENDMRQFKVMVKRCLMAMARQLPGYVNITPAKLPRRLPDVLKTWKRLLDFEDYCVDTPANKECETVPTEAEAVARTPLLDLLQEAGLVGDISQPKLNRGFCPPENYKVSLPFQMARFLVPHVLEGEEIYCSGDSESESLGNKVHAVDKDAEVGSARRKQSKRKSMCLEGFANRVPVPGSKSAYTHSINVGQHGPSDVRTHPKSRSKIVRNMSQRFTRQTAKAQAARAVSESVTQKPPHKNTAGSDEFDKQGLSDLDEEEIDQYVLNPREAAMKAMLSSYSQHEDNS